MRIQSENKQTDWSAGKRRWLSCDGFLHLIGWEDAASFLDQSQSKAQLNQSNHELLSTLSCTFVILDDLV